VRGLRKLQLCVPVLLLSTLALGCPEGEEWDPAMGMCMPKAVFRTSLDVHGTFYGAHIDTSGPRGRKAFSAPDMVMIEAGRQLDPRNRARLSFMGTTDLWTVPENGTPELLQSGESKKTGLPFVDAQHPHSSPIMGLELSNTTTLAPGRKITVFGAPRGEAEAGVPTFMHRESAQGNMDAPLGHHLQDATHISSSVIGARIQSGNTTAGVSAFCGLEPSPQSVDLKMCRPDSYGARLQQKLSGSLTVGGSLARISSTHPNQVPERERSLAVWVSTHHALRGGATLSTFATATQVVHPDEARTLHSLLTEANYQQGSDRAFLRAERLERTPEQLQLAPRDGSDRPRSIHALSVGYERQVLARSVYDVGVGGALTQLMLPRTFQDAYGGNPRSLKISVRVGIKSFRGWEKIAPSGGGEPGGGEPGNGEPGGPGEPVTKKKPPNATSGL
jgi:hypothetical protein